MTDLFTNSVILPFQDEVHVGVSKTTPRFDDALGGLQDSAYSEYLSVLTAKVYYSERIQSKISKGRPHMGQSQHETRHKLPPSRITQDVLSSTSSDL